MGGGAEVQGQVMDLPEPVEVIPRDRRVDLEFHSRLLHGPDPRQGTGESPGHPPETVMAHGIRAVEADAHPADSRRRHLPGDLFRH